MRDQEVNYSIFTNSRECFVTLMIIEYLNSLDSNFPPVLQNYRSLQFNTKNNGICVLNLPHSLRF